jgi:hypothetical protein
MLPCRPESAGSHMGPGLAGRDEYYRSGSLAEPPPDIILLTAIAAIPAIAPFASGLFKCYRLHHPSASCTTIIDPSNPVAAGASDP